MIARLVTGILATWCLSVLLNEWKGLRKLREWAEVYGPYDIVLNPVTNEEEFVPGTFLGRQLSCFWCCALWSGIFISLVLWIWWYAAIPFALAGATIWIGGGNRIMWRKMIDGLQ